jgi:hypothetical protein
MMSMYFSYFVYFNKLFNNVLKTNNFYLWIRKNVYLCASFATLGLPFGPDSAMPRVFL